MPEKVMILCGLGLEAKPGLEASQIKTLLQNISGKHRTDLVNPNVIFMKIFVTAKLI